MMQSHDHDQSVSISLRRKKIHKIHSRAEDKQAHCKQSQSGKYILPN